MPAWKNWRPRRPAAATDPAPDDDTTYDEEYDAQAADDTGEPWYSVGPPAGPDPHGPQTWTVSPGVHVTVAAPPPPPEVPAPDPRRQRIRRWLVRHGLAAGIGWSFGLYQALDAFLDSLGHGGAAAGLAMAGFGWWFAEVVSDYLARIPLIPRRALPALRWAARVPFATALLVTLLHAPNAQI